MKNAAHLLLALVFNFLYSRPSGIRKIRQRVHANERKSIWNNQKSEIFVAL
jgi:hypothetical protein